MELHSLLQHGARFAPHLVQHHPEHVTADLPRRRSRSNGARPGSFHDPPDKEPDVLNLARRERVWADIFRADQLRESLPPAWDQLAQGTQGCAGLLHVNHQRWWTGFSPVSTFNRFTRRWDAPEELTPAIAVFTDLILRGGVPELICPVFFGASLTPLRKKCGGIHLIACGTWRRPAAKLVLRRISIDFSAYLAPHRLEVGAKGGSEICAHAGQSLRRMSIFDPYCKCSFSECKIQVQMFRTILFRNEEQSKTNFLLELTHNSQN